jgi:ribosomal-protein-alanine N-acetyltransferase
MVEMRIEDFKANIGYVIALPFWRRGLATEAVRSIVNWSLKQERIYRVWAVCDVDNAASARVLEKVGMQREGVLRSLLFHPNISSHPRDSYCYSVIKSVD